MTLSLITNEASRSIQPPLATDGDYGFFGAQSLGFITNEITRPIGGEFGALPELPAQPWTFGAEGDPLVPRVNPTTAAIWGIVSTASMAASAYHGYKRNDSVGWALWWGLMGALFPVITPTIGFAQGFGKRKH